MAETIITAYFEDPTGPLTGLTPTLRIWEVNESGQDLVVGSPCGSGSSPATDATMTEMVDCGSPVAAQDGFYRFTFSDTIGYDVSKTYVVRIDGGSSLGSGVRYQTAEIAPTPENFWNSDPNDFVSSSPNTMGGILNEILNSVETIRLNDIPAVFNLLDLVRKYDTNRTKIDAATNTLTIYDDDCTTPLRIFRLLDSSGASSVVEVCERTSIDGTVDGDSPSGFTGDDGQPTCSSTAP